jgi:hypothetical protein
MSPTTRDSYCAPAKCEAASSVLCIPREVFNATFDMLRRCGDGRWECQVLWVGPWSSVDRVTRLVHPVHDRHVAGFQLSSEWLTRFWLELALCREGVRAQVHTHPELAFHSATDDSYPIVHTEGFLSLVIPYFARGVPSLKATYLAEIDSSGTWREVKPSDRLRIE